MPFYSYYCEEHGEKLIRKPMAEATTVEHCECGNKMAKMVIMPAVHGTRDSFGVGKEFYDEKTGKVIDNWKDWEKAGYKPATEGNHSSHVKEGIKRKVDKIENHDSGKRLVIGGTK